MKKNTDQIIEQDAIEVIRLVGKRIEKLRGKTIVITGANGVVGSYLVEVLHIFNKHTEQRPSRIIAITHHPVSLTSRLWHLLGERDISFVSGDVTQPLHLPFRPDYIIHSASYASPKLYLAKPIETMEANSIGTKQMLELARRSRSRNILFVSSGSVYGDARRREGPFTEKHCGYVSPLEERAVYSESKRFGETLCMIYARWFGVHATIARLSNMYGPGFKLDDGRAIPDFFQQAFNKNLIQVNGDPKTTRGYIYISDAVSGLLDILLDGSKGEAYNIANEKSLTIKKIAEKICGLFFSCRVEVKEDRTKNYLSSSFKHTAVSAKKLREALSWEPVVDIDEGLKRLHSWYKGEFGKL